MARVRRLGLDRKVVYVTLCYLSLLAFVLDFFEGPWLIADYLSAAFDEDDIYYNNIIINMYSINFGFYNLKTFNEI